MKTRLIFTLLAACAFFSAARAADPATTADAPDDKPVLAFIISENLGRHTHQNDDFIRLDVAFTKVAKERNWPVKIVMERFAANVPEYENEVSIFMQPLRSELPGELTLRGWTTLMINGRKHDFGVVKFEYMTRPGEWTDRALDNVFLGFAKAVANKIEPVLFPKEKEEPAS